MGANRWLLIAACAALFAIPIEACPFPGLSEAVRRACNTVTHAEAALLYKLAAAPLFYLFVSAGFAATADIWLRHRIVGALTLAFVPISLLMHTPYFAWGPLVLAHPGPMFVYDLSVLLGFILWALFGLQRSWSQGVWRRVDPGGRVPTADRRRVLFWHPATALFLHHMAATTDLFSITMP